MSDFLSSTASSPRSPRRNSRIAVPSSPPSLATLPKREAVKTCKSTFGSNRQFIEDLLIQKSHLQVFVSGWTGNRILIIYRDVGLNYLIEPPFLNVIAFYIYFVRKRR